MAGRDALLDLHRAFALHRAAAQRLKGLRDRGRAPAATRCGRGYEAVSAGAACALRAATDGRGDVVAPTLDNAGALFAFGGTPLEFFRQHLARGSAAGGGRAPGMCPTDFRRGLVGPAALPGTMVEVMAGIALAFRLRGQDRVALVFSSEDETSAGAWHEGFNFAAARRCPLIVVVHVGTEASTAAHTRARGFAPKAAGYGTGSASVDAADALAVHGAVAEAAARARAGRGATLVEARGCPVSRRGPRAAGECGEHRRDEDAPDPLDRLRDWLVREGIVRASHLDDVERRARAEVRAACARALDDAPATGEHALGGVRGGDAGAPPWYRRNPPERGLALASTTGEGPS